jgi:predicted nucleic acid-binding protein
VPDAIIAASSLCTDIPLVSSDSIFERVAELQWVHYQRSGQ